MKSLSQAVNVSEGEGAREIVSDIGRKASFMAAGNNGMLLLLLAFIRIH